MITIFNFNIRCGDDFYWSSSNTPPNKKMLCFNLSNSRFKIGDGVTLWNSLDYFESPTNESEKLIGLIQEDGSIKESLMICVELLPLDFSLISNQEQVEQLPVTITIPSECRQERYFIAVGNFTLDVGFNPITLPFTLVSEPSADIGDSKIEYSQESLITFILDFYGRNHTILENMYNTL